MTGLDYSIHRSARRRSICIQVREAQVQVRAPLGVSDAELHAFVQQKRAWIESHLRQQQHLLAMTPRYCYEEGCYLPYLGGELQLTLGQSNRGHIALQGNQLLIQVDTRHRLGLEDQVRRLVTSWYQRQALSLLTVRTEALARQLGLECKGVSVRATRSKWGHCTREGYIQYNWQIILAPSPVVDYLVAHEVCHLRHLNHSPAYWDLVASICPEYQQHRAWLKSEGAKLQL